MAFQRDYVLRLIEMMGELFRRLKAIAGETLREAELDAVCRDQCGLSLKAAMDLATDTLQELLPPRAVLTLSELIYIRAEAVAWQETQREEMYLHSLRLLVTLYEEETLCAERTPRLKKLMDACNAQLTPQDYMSCARFFLNGQRYDHCEDALFMAVEMETENEPLITAGLEMLGILLQMPEEELLPGGLSRREVMEAMDDLEAWRKA